VQAPAFTLHPRFETVAIASPHSAAAVAVRRNIPQAFASTEEMLASVDLDLVSVASPPFDHHPSVMAAIAAGKHVICEKPFALNVAQAEEMTAAAQRAGVIGAMDFEFRGVPAIRALVELAVNGHLGALRQIEVSRLSGELREASTDRARGWWFERERGGGVGNTMMPHFFDLATQLAGRAAVATSGFMRTANAQRTDAAGTFTSTVADGAFALVDYGAGLVARVNIDSTSIVDSTTLAIHGERRSAIASGPRLSHLTVFTIDAEEQDELEIAPSPYAKHAVIDKNVVPFLALLDRLADAIDLGTPGIATFADGLAVQRQLAAIGYTA
jgi:predicted dehydrogenase